jgi:hypothetical protein
MPDKTVFADHAEKFTMLVDALLSNEGTRSAFTEDPLATLKQFGIEFTDAEVAKTVETELKAFLGSLSAQSVEYLPPQFFAQPRAFVQTETVPRTVVSPRTIVAPRTIVSPSTVVAPRTVVSPRTIVAPRTGVASFVRAASVTWVAKGDREDVMRIDEGRVDAFVTRVDLENRIAALEQQVADLEAELAKR